MADVPDPVPVDGWAYKRPLGHFGKSDASEYESTSDNAAESRTGLARDIASIVLLSLAIVSITAGVTALLGWAWGLIVFGMMCAVIGVLLGYEPTGPNDKDGVE